VDSSSPQWFKVARAHTGQYQGLILQLGQFFVYPQKQTTATDSKKYGHLLRM
jgi:hypothetical protein